MHNYLHYLTLFFVIMLGVASGNLLSNYTSARYVAYQASIAAKKLQDRREVALVKQHAVQKLQQAATEDQRRQTVKGRRLRISCEEWKTAHIQFSTDSTKSEMLKSCDAYVRYVTKGY